MLVVSCAWYSSICCVYLLYIAGLLILLDRCLVGCYYFFTCASVCVGCLLLVLLLIGLVVYLFGWLACCLIVVLVFVGWVCLHCLLMLLVACGFCLNVYG